MVQLRYAKEPFLTLEEVATDGSDADTPDADTRRLFLGEDGNLHLKDSSDTVTDVGGVGSTPAFVGAKAYATATQNTNNASAALTLDSEEIDTDGFHSTASNTSRMTVPAGKAGKYRISGASFASGSADWIILKLNGTTFLRGGGQNVPSAGRWNVTTIQDLSVGDYVELIASSTPSVNWGHATAPDAQTTLSVEFLG